jgi:hypothetical protein
MSFSTVVNNNKNNNNNINKNLKNQLNNQTKAEVPPSSISTNGIKDAPTSNTSSSTTTTTIKNKNTTATVSAANIINNNNKGEHPLNNNTVTLHPYQPTSTTTSSSSSNLINKQQHQQQHYHNSHQIQGVPIAVPVQVHPFNPNTFYPNAHTNESRNNTNEMSFMKLPGQAPFVPYANPGGNRSTGNTNGGVGTNVTENSVQSNNNGSGPHPTNNNNQQLQQARMPQQQQQHTPMYPIQGYQGQMNHFIDPFNSNYTYINPQQFMHRQYDMGSMIYQIPGYNMPYNPQQMNPSQQNQPPPLPHSQTHHHQQQQQQQQHAQNHQQGQQPSWNNRYTRSMDPQSAQQQQQQQHQQQTQNSVPSNSVPVVTSSTSSSSSSSSSGVMNQQQQQQPQHTMQQQSAPQFNPPILQNHGNNLNVPITGQTQQIPGIAYPQFYPPNPPNPKPIQKRESKALKIINPATLKPIEVVKDTTPASGPSTVNSASKADNNTIKGNQTVTSATPATPTTTATNNNNTNAKVPPIEGK